MTPAPEKAAPIPAVDAIRKRVRHVCEESADMLDAWHAERGNETSRAHWKRRALVAEAYLADPEARPSLPDNREERIKAEAAEDERDRLFELFRNDPEVHAYAIGKFVIEGAKEPWWRTKLRARARQGDNNG